MGFTIGNIAGLAEAAKALCAFLGKDMALIGLASFNLTAFGKAEAFGCTPVGLDLWHGGVLL